ncbi:uncharacterized protein BO88DRAFT_176306 [Aspergillus vadensis CBS 113365]|uniref:Uncharacterized protein n=1 Tax=Aspergillus vadensis (strain CBS 113365 / IMI 142717 / IBT 24658) TaxID=1448311 RepID=A0A319CYA5_ASPVC|nr:hypothetical protein BO88DRAFT_176306 [Aspergillus vadensis CBS 113365]PYH73052.1 hypothetical protein BO88DRAFT_176306 [Aspergillus vadensis CBS 113365]
MACPSTTTCPIISSSLIPKATFKSKEKRESASESESEHNSQTVIRPTDANVGPQYTDKDQQLPQDHSHDRYPESISGGGAYVPMSGYFMPGNLLRDRNELRAPEIIAEGLAVPAGKVGEGDPTGPVSSAVDTSMLKLNEVPGNRRKIGWSLSLPVGTATHTAERGPHVGRSSGVSVSLGAEEDSAFEGSYDDHAGCSHAVSDGYCEGKEPFETDDRADEHGEPETLRFGQVDYFTQHNSFEFRTAGHPRRPKYSAAIVGIPCRDTVWAFMDKGNSEYMPMAPDLPWEIRTLHETDELNTIAAYLASMRRRLKDLDINFTFHYRPVSFIDKADRDKKIGGYTSSDKHNAHTVADLYMHTKDDKSWGTLCVTREHHVQGLAWHYWAVAAISPPKSPFQSGDESGVYLLMYDSRPLKEPTKKRDRDFWRNYMRRDQYKLLVEIGKTFKILDLAINRKQLSVEGEDDPLRLTLWWLWNVARYGGGIYERHGDLDDPRWRLTDARWLHFDQDWSSNVRTTLRWKNVKEWFSEQRLDEHIIHE